MGKVKDRAINYAQIVDEMYSLKMQKAVIEDEYEKRRAIIAKAFDSLSVGQTIASDEHIASCRKTLKIEYDLEKLEKRLSKEVLEQIIDKKIIIADLTGLITTMKMAGLAPGELKTRIKIEKEVNKESIKALFDMEQLDIKELEGCYYAQIQKTIIIT